MSLFQFSLGPTIAGLFGRGAAPNRGRPPGAPMQTLSEASRAESRMRTMGLPTAPFPPDLSSAPKRGAAQRDQRPPRPAATRQPDPYTAENFNLGPNSQYADEMIRAARRTNLPPHLIATIFDAEAGPGENEPWRPDARRGQFVGLAQFGAGTWTDEAQRPGTYLNHEARRRGYLDRNGRLITEHRDALLDLRLDPTISIHATADNAARNLAALEESGLITDRTPEARAHYAYRAHHEGLQGARDSLRGTRRINESTYRNNVPNAEEARYLENNGNDRGRAYGSFLNDWIPREADMRRFRRDRPTSQNTEPQRNQRGPR